MLSSGMWHVKFQAGGSTSRDTILALGMFLVLDGNRYRTGLSLTTDQTGP